MALITQVTATSQFMAAAGISWACHQYPTLGDAITVPQLMYDELRCYLLFPHDFALPNTELYRLLRGQFLLRILELQMGPIVSPQDRVQSLDITGWGMVALESLQVRDFFPWGLGQRAVGNEFSNLTSLTLGRVDGLGPQTTVSDFFAAARTWNNLRSLEIEYYSRLMVDPNDLSQHFAPFPLLDKLLLRDEPAWIAKFLTYIGAPLLSTLHLRTSATIPSPLPTGVAGILISWLPQGPEVQDARVFSLLRAVRNVAIHMGENEFQPTRIEGGPAEGFPSVVLEVEAQMPFGMDNNTWRGQYAAWARSTHALGAVLAALPRLFPSTAVSVLEVGGDFDSVLAGHWHALLQHYPELSTLKIHARGSHGVEEVFPALLRRDMEDRDVVCPNLSNITVEDARFSQTFLHRVARALEAREDAMLAFMRLKLVCSEDEYERHFSERGPMVATGLNSAQGRTVANFNLEISDQSDSRVRFFAYGS